LAEAGALDSMLSRFAGDAPAAGVVGERAVGLPGSAQAQRE
jgi:hypothetical protein